MSRVILQMAKSLEIQVVSGDDSHGLTNVASSIESGRAILEDLGFDTQWQKSRISQY